MPLVQTAATRSSAFSRSSRQMETKSSHHTPSASCSAQPGRGILSSCSFGQWRRLLPRAWTVRPWSWRFLCPCPEAVRSCGASEPVVVHVEKLADHAQLLDVVAGDGVDVIGSVAGEYLVLVRVHPGEGVGPNVCRLVHQFLVGVVVVAHEGAAQDVHPVTAI